MHLLKLALLQARGKPQEAAREVRALLNLMRDNEAQVQKMAAQCAAVLEHASNQLTILDPEVGELELIQAVAAAWANLLPHLSLQEEVHAIGTDGPDGIDRH
jgi:hypothetical protein